MADKHEIIATGVKIFADHLAGYALFCTSRVKSFNAAVPKITANGVARPMAMVSPGLSGIVGDR